MADDAADGAQQVDKDFVRAAESAQRAGADTLQEAESTLKEVGSDVREAVQDFGAKLRSRGELPQYICRDTRHAVGA